MTSLNLPATMDFTMGSTEQKMDMTLDEIIKQNRKSKKQQRVPIKSQNRIASTPVQRAANAPSAKAALQRSVAARSSKLRQGKFAEARARSGAANFAATQAAGKRAFVVPIASRNRAWVKSSDPRRANFTRQRPGPGQKLSSFPQAGDNMKISVVNNGSKFGAQRYSAAPFRKRNGHVNPARQVQGAARSTVDRMETEYVQSPIQKPRGRTLDSLFAEMKERRDSQSRVVPTFSAVDRGNRRGRGGFPGRGGYSGWRRRQPGQ